MKARVEELIREYESRGFNVHFSGFPTRYSVYVLNLIPEVQRERKMINQNRETFCSKIREGIRGYLYVGMTGLTVEQRVQNHIQGYKSCSLVRKYYSGSIFTSKGDMTFSEAVEEEREFANFLRAEGYWVYQN